MRSRNVIIMAFLMIMIGASHVFGATLTPYPLKVPKGAYVNSGGVNAKDNFYWQRLTIVPAEAHINGSAFTVTLPAGMSVADVNNDGIYRTEISTLWTDADNGHELTAVVPSSINSTRNTIRFSLGYNEVANGAFTANANGWTLTTATHDAVNGEVDFTALATAVQDLGEAAGNKYILIYTVKNYVAGSVQASIGGAAGASRNANGVWSEVLTATGTGDLTFTGSAAANLSIDDVFVIPFIERNGTLTTTANNWVFDSTWAYDNANTELDHTAAAGNTTAVTQDIGVVAGRMYKVAFTVANRTAGSVTASIGSAAGTARNANAAYIEYLAPTASGKLTFTPTADFDGSIKTISVVPVGVHDGAFDLAAADNQWTENTWTIAGGGGAVNAAAAGALTQTLVPAIANGETYTVVFQETAHLVNGNLTISVGGTAAAPTTVSGTGWFSATVTVAGGGTTLSIAADGTYSGTIDNVYVIRHSSIEVGDVITAMVPVVTLEDPGVTTDSYTVDFLDSTTDDLAIGAGTAITYVNAGPKTLSLVTFAENMTAGGDSTGKLGDVFPASPAATFAALADMVPDGGSGRMAAQNVGITLDGTENNNETLYAVWVSTDSTIAHMDTLKAGVYPALKYPDLTKYLVNETSLGGTQYATAGLPEGKYYFYITSYLTGDFILGRSDQIVVRHWPLVEIFGWDRNHDGSYTPGAPAAGDDGNTALDSGSYFDYTVTKAATGHSTNIDLYAKVEDLDDNALVYIYYATETNLAADLSKIVTTGSSADSTLTVTGLTGGTLIKAGLLENSKDSQGYVKWRWETHPDSVGSVITAANYTLYCVINDGKHLDISNLKGNVGTSLTLSVMHSPVMTIDGLTEYDSNGAAGYQINVQDHDSIMLSWGKSGVFGDNDYDDSAVIEFYIDYDTNTIADYSHDQATTLRQDAATSPTTTHLIKTGLKEDPEDRTLSWYEWNLKEDFKASGWYPTAGANYFIYAIIDENKTGGTARVVTIGSTLPIAATTDLAGYQLVFTNSPFARLIDPPKEGATVNAEQTYRMRFNAFDWDTNGQVGVFLVDTTNFPTGPLTLKVSNLDSLGIKAYAMTDDDGDHTSGINAWVNENDFEYYDLNIRTPGSATPKYTTTMNSVATTLNDDTYWVYVGSEKEAITEKVTNGTFTGNATGWTLANNWAYGANNITSGAAAAGNMSQNINAIAGVTYTVQFDVVSVATGGTLTVSINGGSPMALSLTAAMPATTIKFDLVAGAVASGLVFAKDGVLATAVLDNITVVPNPTLYRAPGPITIVNSGVAAPQRNLTVSPSGVTVAQGDTITFSLRAATGTGGVVDRVDAYVAVEKDYWTLVNETTPFTAGGGFSGMLLTNTVIDDAVNNRWIMRTVVSNASNPLPIDATGVGNAIVTFRLVSKGTSVALDNTTSIYFVNEPANNRVTKFSNNGVDISVNMLQSDVKVIPRGIVEGIVQLQGRNTNNVEFTFELRERGAYNPISDAIFNAANDADPTKAGIQYTPNSDGKFTFYKVPSGEYDLVVAYNRYLSKLVKLNIYPGVDTLFVSFGTMKGGDCIGYVDSVGAVWPNNTIDAADISRIQTAFLSTSASAKWNDGANNYKWADINQDNVVEVDDLSMATANATSSGAQPVYKPANMPALMNADADFMFLNTPSELVAGRSYTIQVVGTNMQQIRAYYVDMNYNSDMLQYSEISKGDFIRTDSYSFPVLSEGSVGLTNSANGDAMFSGDGVIAEVTFIARNNGAFTPDMLSFESVSLVNANFIKETVLGEEVTGVAEVIPAEFALSQNSPNPFNPTTTIEFSVPQNGHVTLNVYDILGRHVRTLVDGAYNPGRHAIVWDAKNDRGDMVSTGVYFYVLKAGNMRDTKKMTLIK